MRLIPKKKTKDTQNNAPKEKLISDKFQFNLAESTLPKNDDYIVENVDSDFSKSGMVPYKETMPAASLFFVESVLDAYAAENTVSAITLDFLEVGYKDVETSGKKKKKKKSSNETPILSILDSFSITFTLDRNYVHLPQIIAEYFLNVPNSDVDYQGRKDYIQIILDFYDNNYGEAFKDLFGVRPSESVSLPSEEEWRTKYSEGEKIQVNAETRENEMDSPAIHEDEAQTNASQPAIPADTIHNSVDDNVQNSPKIEVEEPGEDLLTATSSNQKASDTTTNQTLSASEDYFPDFSEQAQTNNGLDSIFGELDSLDQLVDVTPSTYDLQNIPSVSESNEQYVLSRLDQKKKEFNESRLRAQHTLNLSAQQKMGDKINEIKRDLSDKFEKFDLSHNARERAEMVIKPIIEKELKEAKEKASRDLKANAETLRQQENHRHDVALQEIEANLIDKKKQSDLDLSYEFDRKEIDRIEQSQRKFEVEFNQQKAEQLKSVSSQLLTELKVFAESLQQASNEFMTELINTQNEYLAKYEEQQRQIHVAAQKREIALRAVDIEKGKSANLRQELQEKDEQLAEALVSITQMKNNEAALQGENRTLKANQVSPEQLSALSKTSDSAFTLKDFLEWQKSQAEIQATSKKKAKKKVTKTIGASVVALALLSAGGFGFKAYSDSQSNNERLQKQIDSKNSALKAASSQSSSSSKVVSQNNQPNPQNNDNSASSSQQVDRPYQALDDSLKRNSLDIYRQSFADNKLGDDSYRVFRVGQLLNQQSSRDEAVAVAKANPGYNQTLNRYLGIN